MLPYFLAVAFFLWLSLFFHLLGFWICSLLAGVSFSRLVLGFGPILFEKKSGKCRFQIRLFPLGGYVANPPVPLHDGELDQGLSKMETSKVSQFTVAAGGTGFSLMLSVLLYAILYSQGENTIVTELGAGGASKEVFLVDEVLPGMPAQQAGVEEGDQPLSVNGTEIMSFKHLFDTVQKTDSSKPLTLVVRKGSANGPERVYNLIPVEKETIIRDGVMQKTKLLGFRPRWKMKKVYGNPFSWSYAETKSTLASLFNPFPNKNQLNDQPRLKRNTSGPLSFSNLIDMYFGKIGLKGVMVFFAFLNLFFLAKAPFDFFRINSSRSSVLF